jgi:capsular exopolysaccharide synthesis family protein
MTREKLIVNDQFNPIILRNILVKHWYKPLLLLVFLFFIAFIYLRYTKPIYNSQAVLQVIHSNKVKQVLGEQAPISQDNSLSKDVELLRSSILFEHAVQNLNLNTSVFNEGDLLTENLYGYTPFSILVKDLFDSTLCNTKIEINPSSAGDFELVFEHKDKVLKKIGKLGAPIVTKYFNIEIKTNNSAAFNRIINTGEIYFTFNNKNQLVKELQAGLSITPIDENARTVEILFHHENPKLCYHLIQSIINSYFNFEKYKTQEENSQTIAFINGQLDSLSLVLDHSKDSLNLFQKSQNIPSIEYEESDITGNLSSFSKRLTEINEELNAVIYVNNRISSDVTRNEIYRILPELVGRRSFEGSITRQIEELNKLLESREDLLQDITYESSKVRLINERVSNRIQGVKKSLNAIQERLKHEKRLIENELAKYEGKLLGLPEKTTEFNRLKYMEELNREYFNLFTQKKIEFQINNAGFSSDNRLLSLPTLAEQHVSPNSTKTYLILGISGILIGLAWLLFYYLTYNEITSLADLKNLLPKETTILGSVPLHKSKMKYSQIVITESPKSRISESIRNIKSNLNFINKDARLIAVSSSISGEGKTFVIMNLAATFSTSGKKCIVLDLDLRKPKVHHGFNVDNQKGMSQVLSGLLPLQEVIQVSTIPQLDFITAGPIPPNPSDLIQSETLDKIIDQLKASYDLIFIDNPPVGIVSDGINLLSKADIPIYVFKANYSKRMFAHQLMELFKIQKLDKINVILNAVPDMGSLYGYGYGYGYGYSYGYGGYYSDEDSSPWWKRWLSRFKFKNKKHGD